MAQYSREETILGRESRGQEIFGGAMTHRETSERINQNFDDLKVRSPEKYKELEEDQKRLEHKTSFAVAMSKIPGHVRRAERMS
jgi:hypothetical protein